MNARRGSVLIVVAGMCALFVVLATAFLMRMREDAQTSRQIVAEAQCRVMLDAALMYIQETARIGWDLPTADPLDAADVKEEAYGWTDVRDGLPGPRDRLGRMLYAGDPLTGVGATFPAVGGAAARCEMAMMTLPPCALETTCWYNPMPAQPTGDWRADISYAELDPRPQLATGAPSDVDGRFRSWVAGDPRPRRAGEASPWFRVYRMTPADAQGHVTHAGVASPLAWSPAQFVVACGSGGSRGFRSWAGMTPDERSGFGDDRALFDDLRAAELVRWYACEWHPAVSADQLAPHLDGTFIQRSSNRPVSSLAGDWSDSHAPVSLGGTIIWLERLAQEPPDW
ncbi:MAG: hypothetical protein H0X45_02575 [Planctomycetes bacterium]|nr:hypothetical protein [Planctomycetota bacterium]